MTLYGQSHQQVAYRRKHLGRKLGCADASAQREIIGMHHDLQHPGEQEVISAQGPALPGNQHDITYRTSREQAAHCLQCPGALVGEGRRAKRRLRVVGAAIVRRVVRRGRHHPGGPVVMRVSRRQREDVRRRGKNLRGPVIHEAITSAPLSESEQRARCGGSGGNGSADCLSLTLRVADHNAHGLSRSATFTDFTAAAGGRAERWPLRTSLTLEADHVVRVRCPVDPIRRAVHLCLPTAELVFSQLLTETATRTSRPGRAERLQGAEGSRR